MDDPTGVSATVRAWNEDGTLYFWGGIASAIISWVLIPLFGLAAVYAGYRLYDDETSTTGGAVIAVTGAIGVVSWLAFLAAGA
ncbi:hypothetical protein SAMN05216226_11218 [Halovenus aranensis]|uniref:Uncharacterized protein n=1 Tax=Halovenus aranensis TaxID=890420 RepID=A0A1G8XR30_9EURY|nr:hypothetical protein [Halovenus aranensis]SDJ92644.1 hypothetical protein SAMN05216226_11218 [Halovenus aranensis]